MGKRGPRKLPAKIHERRGTKKPCRHAEPEVAKITGPPPAPAGISDRAREAWESIASKLVPAGLLTDLDLLSLRLLSESVEMYFEAADEIAKSGLTTISDKGMELQHPAVAIRNKAWSQVVKLCQEFGMTPSSRTGLNIETKPPQDDGLSKILGFKVVG